MCERHMRVLLRLNGLKHIKMRREELKCARPSEVEPVLDTQP